MIAPWTIAATSARTLAALALSRKRSRSLLSYYHDNNGNDHDDDDAITATNGHRLSRVLAPARGHARVHHHRKSAPPLSPQPRSPAHPEARADQQRALSLPAGTPAGRAAHREAAAATAGLRPPGTAAAKSLPARAANLRSALPRRRASEKVVSEERIAGSIGQRDNSKLWVDPKERCSIAVRTGWVNCEIVENRLCGDEASTVCKQNLAVLQQALQH
eukprot:COSAG06_NODE_18741_length_869_cov_0.941710_2_plen_217_part_01